MNQHLGVGPRNLHFYQDTQVSPQVVAFFLHLSVTERIPAPKEGMGGQKGGLRGQGGVQTGKADSVTYQSTLPVLI